MRRLAFLAVGGALWLFAAAIPALADGGPHIAADQQRIGGSDRRQLRRAATARTPPRAPSSSRKRAPRCCTSCHGSAGTGATTNVADGVQYQLATSGTSVRGAAPRRAPQRRLRQRPDRQRLGVAVSYLERYGHPTRGQGPGRRDRHGRDLEAHEPDGRYGQHGLGQRADQRDGERRRHGHPRVHQLPQPARERQLPDPQPASGDDRYGPPPPSSAAADCGPSPTRRSRRPATPATTRSSRPRPGRPSGPRSGRTSTRRSWPARS